MAKYRGQAFADLGNNTERAQESLTASTFTHQNRKEPDVKVKENRKVRKEKARKKTRAKEKEKTRKGVTDPAKADGT